MPCLVWSDALSVGVPILDQQHKTIIGLLSLLDDAVREHRGEELVDTVLTQVLEYTVSHFAAEEQLMRESGYPRYVEHKKVHDGFATKIRAIAPAQPGVKALTLVPLLTDWLRDHLRDTDRMYIPHFAETRAA
jgi:hemerythrin